MRDLCLDILVNKNSRKETIWIRIVKYMSQVIVGWLGQV